MASILDLVKHYQQSIEKYPNDEQKVLKCIDNLYNLGVTVQHLQETGVGRTVNALRKEPGEVGQAARALVYKWKVMVVAEESDQEIEHNDETSNYNGHEHGRDYDSNPTESSNRHNESEKYVKKHEEKHHKQTNGDHSGSKRKYHSSEEEGPDTMKSKYSSSKDNGYNIKPEFKVKVEPSDSKQDSQDDTSSESDSDGSHSTEVERKPDVKVKIEKLEKAEKHGSSSKQSSRGIHDTHKYESSSESVKEQHKHNASESSHSSEKSSRDKSNSSQSYKSSKEGERSIKKEKEHRSDKEKSYKEKSSDKHRSSKDPEKHKSSNSSEKHKSNESTEKHKSGSSSEKHKHRSSSEKHRSDSSSVEKHTSRSSSEKHKSSSSEKHRNHSDKGSNGSEKHSSGKPDKDKYKSSSEKEISSDKHKSKETISSSKDKHSSSSKEKSKDQHSSSKEKESSHKSDKKHLSSKEIELKISDSKRKSDSNHDETSCKKSKHKSSSSSSKSSSSKSKEEIPKKQTKTYGEQSDGIDCGSGASFAEALGMISPAKPKKKSLTRDITQSPNSGNEDLSPATLLAPTAKLAPLPALEISALPEISPNYRPRPPTKVMPHFTDEDAMNCVISSKNQRTKVYSGNKVMGKIPTLYEMCVHILQEHIDALEYTGGVPYEILKPVVDRATPQQLFLLEHYNPYLMEDTDHLWQKFCEKSFRTKKRQEFETWREMYMRCQEEQEIRLKSLTNNIRIAQEAKKAPIKQTKMAYVDSVVKPPRNILKKQAQHGTAFAATASPAARVAALAAAPNVLKGGRAAPAPVLTPSASSLKPKKAPLMQKALQFMRGRKR